MAIKIYPYQMGSESARGLAGALDSRRVREDGTYRPRKGDTIINWGNPRVPRWDSPQATWVNHPARVATAGDKLASYRILGASEGINLPEFTTIREVAEGWLRTTRVCGRSLLHASGGRGLTVHQSGATLLPGELVWCKYISKVREFRVHVYKGRVIDTQIKRRRNGVDRENTYIRNLDNGWVFCRSNIVADPRRDGMAARSLEVLSLDFGAVDLIETKAGKLYVLEVNTAPGLEGTTLESYVSAVSASLS